MLTTISPEPQSEGFGGGAIVEFDHMLQLQIVIARAQRPHLVALASLGGIRHPFRVGASHRPVLLDALEVFGKPIAPIDCPARTAAKHGIHVDRRETQCPGAPQPRGDALEERVRQQPLHRLDLRDA